MACGRRRRRWFYKVLSRAIVVQSTAVSISMQVYSRGQLLINAIDLAPGISNEFSIDIRTLWYCSSTMIQSSIENYVYPGTYTSIERVLEY